MRTQWYENPYATAEEKRAAETREGAQRLVDAWPREVQEALARHGMLAHAGERRGGYATVRLTKYLGEWPLQVMTSLEFNPAICDLPRLALLDKLDALLGLWEEAMATALAAEMERAIASEIEMGAPAGESDTL